MDLQKNLAKHWPLILTLFCFLAITLPAFFQTSHVMRNLEPYPDAILYINRAKNFANTCNLAANYLDSNLRVPIPPLYSLYLSFFFIFTSNPNIFYIANLLLGITSLVFLYLIINKLLSKQKHKNLFVFILLALFLSHGFILWLPGLALIENLGLALLLLSLYVILNRKLKIPVYFSALLTSSWIFTKLNFLPFSALLFILFSFNFYKSKKYLNLFRYFSGVLLMAAIYISFEIWSGENHFAFLTNLMSSKVTSPDSTSGTAFFSLSYFIPNTKKYLSILLGTSSNFLWLKLPAFNLLITLLTSAGVYLAGKNKKYKNFAKIILAFFLFQFPLLLVFTGSDARYIILSIPIFIIGLGLLVSNIKNLKINYLILGILLFSQFYLQKSFYKQIISENILGRSNAWQQEAVLNFNFALPKNSLIITALPPFFIDLYQVGNYQVLPLSKHQEFINKNKWFWNSELKNFDLLKLYDQLLTENKNLYISNSYVTHSHLVLEDYEELKKKYNFELVKTGCNNACNIYEISQ